MKKGKKNQERTRNIWKTKQKMTPKKTRRKIPRVREVQVAGYKQRYVQEASDTGTGATTDCETEEEEEEDDGRKRKRKRKRLMAIR